MRVVAFGVRPVDLHYSTISVGNVLPYLLALLALNRSSVGQELLDFLMVSFIAFGLFLPELFLLWGVSRLIAFQRLQDLFLKRPLPFAELFDGTGKPIRSTGFDLGAIGCY